MNTAPHLYEATIIINASLEDPQVEIVVGRLQELIAKHGGSIAAINRWGRKRLTYPIKKKNSGYYVNIEFTAPGTIVKQLEHFYQLEEQILRFLTIKMEKKALQAREISFARKQADEAALAASDAAAAQRAADAAAVRAAEEAQRAAQPPLFEGEPPAAS